ncbi:polysaccharide export protein [Dysgonomonas sp. OttesenSCG-928-M03]|nr:polysaccharide export protein [Dysgonomonas sp. OttesenSCG-928-M03]
MRKYYLLICIITATLLYSCGSNQNISYFQDLEKYEYLKGEIAKSDSLNKLTIKPNDELAILVSSIEPQAVIPFNLPSLQGKPSSYLVNADGEINFPTLGKLKLGGLSPQQATDLIQNRLEEYINNPIVNVQILNFRISVLGAVNAPGPFYFTNGRVTILDAIANARDLTLHARRDNVLLIRENGDKKEFVRFDLTKSNDVFSSQYFYLQQNDIIYVEPNKEFQKDAGMSQQKQFNLTLVTTGVTALISAISLIIAVSNK